METKQLETWRNNTAGRIILKRLDGRGNVVDELIAGYRAFSLTPEERRLNQDRASSKDVDSFSNGMLVPVRLLDGEEDAAEIAANPNLLSDAELKKLFKAKGAAFAAHVEGIGNPVTLNRLREVALEIDATVGQVAAIDDRLAALAPRVAGDAVVGPAGEVRTSAPESEGRIRAVTPR